MKSALFSLLVVSLQCIDFTVAHADTEGDGIECLKSASFLAPTEPLNGRHYAPARDVEMLHVVLDVTPDFQRRTIEATTMLHFKPLGQSVREVKLNAVDLDIHNVTATEPLQGYQNTGENLILTFVQPIPVGHETSVTISYHAEPVAGLYFRTPEMGYKPGDTHLFTQGEEIDARYWYPCLDSPNQRFTSEVTCRVPEGMIARSNGRLVAEERDPATGLAVFHWSQEKSHANYLVTLVAGYFKGLHDQYKDIPLGFFTPASEFNEAANSFRDTKDIMAFFEQEIGVPFPWAKYDEICVNDFVAGGMENTSATTLTDRTLFTDATENIRDSDGLLSHEMAHQWFGDLVTCKDWSHIWLNEGFATYYESLYTLHKRGQDDWLYELYTRGRSITTLSNDVNPIVRRTYEQPRDMFNYLAYGKGSWVLHMLRCQLGEELYRKCIRTYLERHQYGNVVTDDLRAVLEELSGRSLDQFFDQWVYHAHFPELEVNYSWDEPTKLARISVRQTQALSDAVLLFDFPLAVRFKGPFGTENREAHVTQKEEDFYFPLPSAPEIVRLDPDCALLAKIHFSVANGMLYAQLADTKDMLGRVVAVEQLAAKKDKESVARLQHALNHDPFFGVRLEASKALRSIHSEEARAALLASTSQPDARVRREVMADLGGFYRDSTYDSARKTLDHEKNPDIEAVALRSLGGYAKPEVAPTLLKFLDSKSYRNELAVAAIEAMQLQDDPVYLSPLLESLSKREEEFTSQGYAQGLGALGYLARNEEKKQAVREFLVARLNDKKRTVQMAAIRALGTLGDPQAIAVLDTFASAGKDTPERAAAERAVTELRAGRKPVDDFKNLRQEVLDLQKANRDLRKELDDLKRKVEAKPASVNKSQGKQKP